MLNYETKAKIELTTGACEVLANLCDEEVRRAVTSGYEDLMKAYAKMFRDAIEDAVKVRCEK